MCGIVGYTGSLRAVPVLCEGLARLEYRGYDSAGVAVEDADAIDVVCRRGKVSELAHTLGHLDLQGTCGIGHTRWATHGRPTEANAHPHTSCAGDLAIVHNGIIENFAELRDELIERGHVFRSQTDSEVVAHLLEEELGEGACGPDCVDDPSRRAVCASQTPRQDPTRFDGASFCDERAGEVLPGAGCKEALCSPSPSPVPSPSPSPLLGALARVCGRLIGSFAIAAVWAGAPGVVCAARKDSPLVAGLAADGAYLASDVIAILDKTRDVYVVPDDVFVELAPGKMAAFAERGGELLEVSAECEHIDWDLDLAEKGGYADFMLKEIHEQPRVIRDTLAGRLVDGALKIDELSMSAAELNMIDRVYIIACGTSYHAGLIAKNLIEGWARVPCEVEVASEFRYRNPIITPTTLVVAVSQSGETADTLAAIRDARIKGARVFGITNVVGSPVARESDGVIYTKANKEIAVASTKSFLGQVVSLVLLAMLLAQVKGKFTTAQTRLIFTELADTAEAVEKVLDDYTLSSINKAAHACKDAASALFIGRGMGAAVAYEGALKLKEISYLHAEAYAAGEMKHGPIALIDEGFPVIAVATQSPTYDKVISNLQESRARGALVVAIATEGDTEICKHADYVIYVPRVRDALSPIVTSVPLQLFARAIALLRGCDVDRPRNLAKSVTVE